MVQLDGRRLVRALVLGLLVLLLVGGGAGVVVGAGDEVGNDTLLVPRPGPGDRAVYVAKEVILDAELARPWGMRLSRVTMEWLPARTVTASDFAVVEAHPLRATFLWNQGTSYESSYVREAVYDAATGRPLFDTSNGTSWSDGTNYGLVLEDLAGDEPKRSDFTYDAYLGTIGPCGARVPLQGIPFNGGSLRVEGNCDWPGGLEGFTYVGQGWTEGPRGRSYAFEAKEDSRFHLWYDGESPFPARWQASLQEVIYQPYTFGRYFEMERVESVRSGVVYPLAQPPAPRPPLPLAPLTETLLDDSDVAHEFPLGQALAAALADENPSPFTVTASQFYAAHPGTYPALAIFQLVADRQGQFHPNWWFAFTDGQDVLTKRVERASALSPGGGLYGPNGVAMVDYVYDWNPDPDAIPADARGVFPPAGLLPTHLPRPKDLMDRYAQMTGSPANAYGFEVRCATPACLVADVFVQAGDSRANIQDAVNVLAAPVATDRAIIDSLWVDAHGALVSRVSFVAARDGAFPVVESSLDPRVKADSPTSRQAGVWAFPQAPAVAGLSFLAVLASALYYFWPSLKGLLGAGLFSRIQDDRVLEHPRRAAIHQLVQAEPGIHFQDMARRLGMGRGTLEHHVRKMVAAGLLSKVQSGGYACYFPKGRVDRRLMAAAPVLRSGGGRAVFDAVKAHPGQSSRDLATRLGLAPSTVSYHLRRLQEAGLVFSGGAGVQLSPLGEQAA